MVKKSRKKHRFRKKKPIYRNRFFWFFIFILFFLFLTVYFLFFSDFFKVKEINFSGLEKIEQEKIDSLISLKSIFLINLTEIEEEILKKFPEISKVEIRRRLPDTLNISIREREEFAIFCQAETCFLLDKNSFIFEPAEETDPLIKIKDERKVDPFVLGERVIGKKELNSILEINSRFKDKLNISIKEFIIFSEKLTVVAQGDWEIYFNLQEDIGWQLTKLEVLLEERIPKEERENLEYIELRFGNFANPKYKD